MAPHARSEHLVRPQQGKVIAGVCAGIADRFGYSRTLVRRRCSSLSVLLPGPQFIAYIVLWLAMPKAG